MARKGGKYAHITPHLPKLVGVGSDYTQGNTKYQDRIDQTKREILMEPEGGTVSPDAHAIREALEMPRVDDAEDAIKEVHQYLLRRCAGQNHATTLVAAYAACRDLKDRIKEWESNTNLLIEAYAQLMLAAMDAEGVTSMRFSDRLLSTWDEPYTTVTDRAANLAWAARECEYCQLPRHEHREDEHGSLAGVHQEIDPVTQEAYTAAHFFKPNGLRQSLMLSWQTLDSLVKRMLLAGDELPPGVTVWSKPKIRLGGEE